MKPVSISADYATRQVPAKELARLSDLVGPELDLQEPRLEALDDEHRQALSAIYKTLNRTLTEMWHEEERRGPPFGIAWNSCRDTQTCPTSCRT